MFIELFFKLRTGGIPATITEYLTLMQALDNDVVDVDIDQFYYLARASLIKDERFFDRFDVIFADHFSGVESLFDEFIADIPAEWLQLQEQLNLTEEEKAQVEALGGWDKLMQTLRDRLEEQKERHQGGDRMIGTSGRSPFGAYGYNPEGIRLGQHESRHRKAVKVWDKREFRNFDDSLELGTRNIKLALRNLRKFAREGASEELDIDNTIDSTARNAGYLDIRMVPERHNAVKVLLFLDVGGSMSPHIRVCEELFSAARNEFKHLEYFYFHNCVYERVWKDNRRRYSETTATMDVIHKFGPDHKLLFVGDASMSPYEIMMEGGSVEHWNEESGAAWLARLLSVYPCAAWLNPVDSEYWDYTASIRMINELLQERMFNLTLQGLNEAIDTLKHRHVH